MDSNQKIYLYPLIFLAVCLVKCTDEASLTLPDPDNKMVVNCVFSANSEIHLRLLESYNNDLIINASAQLYSGGEFIGTFEYMKQQVYKIPGYLPVPGTQYSITINAKGFADIYAEDYIPNNTPILDIIHTDSAGYNYEFNYNYANLTISFEDTPHVENFYEVVIFSKIDINAMEITDSIVDETTIEFYNLLKQELRYRTPDIFSFDPIIQNEGFESNIGAVGSNQSYLLFSDDLINGKKTNLSINYIPYYARTSYIKVKERDIIIHFRSVSKNYYLYRKRIKKYIQYNNALVWRDLNDFVRLYSNIEDGYGLFAGYVDFIDTISLKNE
jgi:hypothetical protein